jgi:uncharacterized protein (DUF983 family)
LSPPRATDMAPAARAAPWNEPGRRARFVSTCMVPGFGKVLEDCVRQIQRRPARAARMVGRALRRRCPNCGGPRIFRNYLQQRDACPHCHLRLDRGEADFFIGAYTINLIAAELLVVLSGVVAAILTWPDVPWDALTVALVLLMVLAPAAFYPLSRQLWLAFDLIFRPPGPADFAPPRVT